MGRRKCSAPWSPLLGPVTSAAFCSIPGAGVVSPELGHVPGLLLLAICEHKLPLAPALRLLV